MVSQSRKHQSHQQQLCCFCKSSEDNELLYGKVYRKRNLYMHYYCLLLSSNLKQNGRDYQGIMGFLLSDIKHELKQRKKTVCFYCTMSGATVACCFSNCRRVFHLTCGRRKGTFHQFFDQFKSYCHAHRLQQRIPHDILEAVSVCPPCCTICLEEVSSSSSLDALWGSCCKNSWYHRSCIQKFALSTGYFFKCPQCNDKTIFKKTMLRFGIFVPEQDASWELEPNAYGELLQQHKNCDATHCLCPKGRRYSRVGTIWELAVCSLCGSKGTHKNCSQTVWLPACWECDECQTILQRSDGARSLPDGADINSNQVNLSNMTGHCPLSAAETVPDMATNAESTNVKAEELLPICPSTSLPPSQSQNGCELLHVPMQDMQDRVGSSSMQSTVAPAQPDDIAIDSGNEIDMCYVSMPSLQKNQAVSTAIKMTSETTDLHCIVTVEECINPNDDRVLNTQTNGHCICNSKFTFHNQINVELDHITRLPGNLLLGHKFSSVSHLYKKIAVQLTQNVNVKLQPSRPCVATHKSQSVDTVEVEI